MNSLRNNISGTFALLLASLLIASCGRDSQSHKIATTDSPTSRRPPLPVGQPAATLQTNGGDRDKEILGIVPADPPPTQRTHAAFQLGSELHDLEELVSIGLTYLATTEPGIVTNGLKGFVVFLPESDEACAEVSFGSGIGKPTWTLTITKKLKVAKCLKGIGKG
jgi:hypothetical protein